MTKLPPNLEAMAVKLAALPMDRGDADFDAITEVIGGLSGPLATAVLNRASELQEEHIQKLLAEAQFMTDLLNLARAAGCPKGAKIVPWLMKQGLVTKEADGTYRIRKPGPAAA